MRSKINHLDAMEARTAASVEHCLTVIEAYSGQPFGRIRRVEPVNIKLAVDDIMRWGEALDGRE